MKHVARGIPWLELFFFFSSLTVFHLFILALVILTAAKQRFCFCFVSVFKCNLPVSSCFWFWVIIRQFFPLQDYSRIYPFFPNISIVLYFTFKPILTILFFENDKNLLHSKNCIWATHLFPTIILSWRLYICIKREIEGQRRLSDCYKVNQLLSSNAVEPGVHPTCDSRVLICIKMISWKGHSQKKKIMRVR